MSGVQQPGNASSRPRPQRRSAPRVAMACRQCKARKSKCDGLRPRCGPCCRDSRECEYNAVDGRRARHTEAEFIALTNRIADLEQQVQRLKERQQYGLLAAIPGDELSPVLPTTFGNGADSFVFSGYAAEEEHHLSGPYDLGADTDLEDPSNSFVLPEWDIADFGFEESLDLQNGEDYWLSGNEPANPGVSNGGSSSALEALTTVLGGLRIDSASGETVYVGPVSNLHRIRRLPLDQERDGRSEIKSLQERSPAEQETMFQSKERDLMELFHIHVHPHFPFLDFKGVTEGQTPKWSAILYNIVLAVGAHFLSSDSPDTTREGGEEVLNYYLKSFSSLIGDEVDRYWLSNIQAFLLRSYLATLQGSLESATIFLGIACAMAKRIGLHVDSIAPNVIDCVSYLSSAKERQALFWALFWMDRRLAMIEGRACLIPAFDMSTPRPLELLQKEVVEFKNLPLSFDLIYACHVEFSHIQDINLGKLYSFSRPTPREDAISNGHLQFISWYNSLPKSMKDVKAGQAFHPSFLAFHMTFHGGLIQLHRTALKGEGRGAQLANQRCRNSAAIITSFLKTYRRHFSDTVADYMVIHAASTAAVVHLVLLQHPDIASYRCCIRALKSTVESLSAMIPRNGYARLVYNGLKEFAEQHSIGPANSKSFWPV